MKKVFIYMLFAILLIIAGCSPETLMDGQKVSEQRTDDKSTVITFTSRMPDEGTQTRISLERDDLDIRLKWETGDELEVCLQYETETEEVKAEKQVIEVTNISPDGKTADFAVTIPEGIETFNLYGVYGGALNPANLTQVFLPSSSTAGSLDELKASKAVMLTFAKTGIQTAAPNLLVDLKHIGSLFCIQLRNSNTTVWNSIKTIQLSAATAVGAYDNTAVLDLATGIVSGNTSRTELTFELSEATNIAPGAVQEFWGWFVPLIDQNWPEMNLKVLKDSGPEVDQSINSKPARKAVTPVGKAFYFSASYDGTDLRFMEPLIDVDGNVYTTVIIDNLEWMTENLRVTHYKDGTPIPEIFPAVEWLATTTGAYTIYPYESTPTTGPFHVTSEEEMVIKYGLLYNGHAVLDPRGLAPEGWRVASDEDYKALERAAGMSEIDIEKTGGRGSVGAKLRVASWVGPPVGTDVFGFAALPGGYRQGEGDGNFRVFGTWDGNNLWTSTVGGSGGYIYRRSIRLNPIERILVAPGAGLHVRCVREKQN